MNISSFEEKFAKVVSPEYKTIRNKFHQKHHGQGLQVQHQTIFWWLGQKLTACNDKKEALPHLCRYVQDHDSPSDRSNWRRPRICQELSPCPWLFLQVLNGRGGWKGPSANWQGEEQQVIDWTNHQINKELATATFSQAVAHCLKRYLAYSLDDSFYSWHPGDAKLTCFSCPGRSGWSSAQRHSKSLCQSDVATISQRRDDEPIGAADKLVLVLKVDIGDANDGLVRVVVEVEACLLKPLKVGRRLDVHRHLQKVKWKNIGRKSQRIPRQLWHQF